MPRYVDRHSKEARFKKSSIVKNKNIVTIYEKDIISCKNVFNIFWKANTNIIYIVDNNECLLGVLTNQSFMKQLKKNECEKIFENRNCIVISKETEENMYEEAERMFEKYHITTAVPVVDEKNKVCFELRRKGLDDEKKIIAEYQQKFTKYKKSYYLSEEVACLRKLLEEQDIVVIGKEERFTYMFGDLIFNRNNIYFVDELEDAYEFMYNNGTLMIDLSPTGYGGRFDIYRYSNNGYSWKDFFAFAFSMIEREYCSKFYKIIQEGVVSLRDFLEKYMVGAAYFSKRSIFTVAIMNYMIKNCFDVVDQKGIFRTESFRCNLKLNAIEVSKKRGDDELTLVEYVDIVLQLYKMNILLSGRVPVLNFVFNDKVEVTDTERIRMEEEIFDGSSNFSNKLYDYAELYSLGENKREYLEELTESIQFRHVRAFENNLVVWKDMESRLVNIENGMRRTSYQPKNYIGTIYFVGGCTIWGALVEDQFTIPSIIQKYVNQIGSGYRVVNLANGNLINAANLLASLNIEENDIFVFLFPVLMDNIKKKIPIIEIGERFNELRKSKYSGVECFFNMVQHCGTNGNIIYSDIIYEELKKYLIVNCQKKPQKNNLYNVFSTDFRDLDILYGYKSFLTELKSRARDAGVENDKKVGCIVMNCNPFTLGHRYLVEYAMSKMDYLYIFIVEEDKSFFPFNDRYEMVKRGTIDLKKVVIIRSGIIASTVTFPAYFQKQEIAMLKGKPSVSMDLKVFAQYIAPAVNIRYRFVGEEPKDFVTAEYNTKMQEILPEFGIEVVEIPRKCADEKIISASEVREYYNRNDFKNMENMVPKTTLNYLKEKKLRRGEEYE